MTSLETESGIKASGGKKISPLKNTLVHVYVLFRENDTCIIRKSEEHDVGLESGIKWYEKVDSDFRKGIF